MAKIKSTMAINFAERTFPNHEQYGSGFLVNEKYLFSLKQCKPHSKTRGLAAIQTSKPQPSKQFGNAIKCVQQSTRYTCWLHCKLYYVQFRTTLPML